MQTVYIVSSGCFYRPVRTPMGRSGWVGEINFWYAPTFEGEKLRNISKVFKTEQEANEFVSQKLFKLFRNKKYRFRDYGARTISRGFPADAF